MRLSELAGKEVINLTDAARLGVIRNPQALIDTETGRVEALLVPFANPGHVWRHPRRRLLAVPWRAVRRLGREIVIVEVKTPSREDRRQGAIAIAAKGE